MQVYIAMNSSPTTKTIATKTPTESPIISPSRLVAPPSPSEPVDSCKNNNTHHLAGIAADIIAKQSVKFNIYLAIEASCWN